MLNKYIAIGNLTIAPKSQQIKDTQLGAAGGWIGNMIGDYQNLHLFP